MARKQMLINISANPALVIRQQLSSRMNLDDENDMDLINESAEETEQPTKAPKTDGADRLALLHGHFDANEKVAKLSVAAGASAVQK